MDFIAVIYMIAVLMIPAYLTLQSIQVPVQPVFISGSAIVSDSMVAKADHKPEGKVHISPLGYTRSLSFFIVIIIANWSWIHFFFREKFTEKSFWLSVAVLIPIGFILDIAFGNLFFNFPNQSAILGIHIPGYSFEKGAWIWDLPIEEFIFYTTGFIAILTVYLTCDDNWFELYNRFHYAEENEVKISEIEGIIKHAHYPSLIVGAILIVAAVLYKKYGAHEYNNGFPGYFTFLVVVAMIPSFVLFNTAKELINWRAVSFTIFYILLISILWEATLASPYGWWRYNYDQMMGIVIKPWSRLPIEAALLWLVVTFTTVIVYNTIKIWLISGKTLRKFFLG